MSGLNAVDVYPADISRHLENLKRQGLGLKSVKTQRTVYSLIYKNAINSDRYGREITTNPAAGAQLPRGLKSEKREAPEDEVIEKIRSGVTNAYWGLFAMFLISTGCRRGEALAVTWGDIDRSKKEIHICKSVKYRSTSTIGCEKTEAGNRFVPLLPDLDKLLIRPVGAKDADYVFASQGGSFLPESTYKRRWKHYCKDQGFFDLTAHTLRHGYATMLFEAGVDVYTAQHLLGHSDIKTTMAVYTHLRERKKKSSLEKLNNYVQSNYTPVDVNYDVSK